RVEVVQRVAELVERERLHVPLDIRGLLRRIALRERAELRRRHRQWPGSEQHVLERHRGAAEERSSAAIQSYGVLNFVDRTDLQVIVQVRADSGQVVRDRDTVLGEQRTGADARKLQDLRGTDRTGSDQYLATRANRERCVTAEAHDDPGCAPRAVARL